MKKVFICSPYRGDTSRNIEQAKRYARFAYGCKYLPIVPHLYFPSFLSDDVPSERMDGIMLGLELMKQCEEIWIFGCRITDGMAFELAMARQLGILVDCYDEEISPIRHETFSIDERLDDRYRSVVCGMKFV